MFVFLLRIVSPLGFDLWQAHRTKLDSYYKKLRYIIIKFYSIAWLKELLKRK